MTDLDTQTVRPKRLAYWEALILEALGEGKLQRVIAELYPISDDLDYTFINESIIHYRSVAALKNIKRLAWKRIT